MLLEMLKSRFRVISGIRVAWAPWKLSFSETLCHSFSRRPIYPLS